MERAVAQDRTPAGRRERVLFELARRDKSNVLDTFRAITEASAIALDVARVSVWRLLPGGGGIVCEDCFLRDEGRHEHGETIYESQCPSYFSALSANRVISAPDARLDPRTRELRDYLESRGISS